ncbi:unnamed protein product [Adineta steineri]|uniref:Uncharacterized protein n=1 Tax=Adineta steineri TaxID=433720 RepID=A0A814GTA8_9BILA|nr:unnamed protein product [Adineta steineri]
MPISFVSTSDDTSNKNLNHVDPSFIYTEILKQVLFTIQFDQKHFKDFIAYCRLQFAENNHELISINELERSYYEKTPIWWYMQQCFVYPMLNFGLRTMNADIIHKMSFLINDLHRQIEKLHSEQFSDCPVGNIFTVYYGQGLSIANFEQLKKTKGGLMSFNNFLLTSKKRDVSMEFTRNALSNSNLVGILFVMTIDPSQSKTPFACIENVSYSQEAEGDVLFSLHSVFRIDDIQRMSDNTQLFQVNLTLIGINDDDLRQLTDRIHQEIFPEEERWFGLGRLLLKIGEPKKAEGVFNVLLDHSDKVEENETIYYYIGSAKNDQGKYHEAIQFYEKSLEIHAKTLPSNHPCLATSHDAIGDVYKNMSDYSNALVHYEKALKIKQQSLPPNHLSVALSYNNIGSMYENMGDNLEARLYCEKALEINEKILASDHPDLAASYKNIGNILCNNSEDYEKALWYFEKALVMEQQAHPPDHLSLASSYINIGLVYESIGDYSKALPYYDKYLETKEESLAADHSDWPTLYNDIGSAYERIGYYTNALSCHEKALAIQQRTLSHKNPTLTTSYNNIGFVYEKMGDYRKAGANYERAVTIAEHSLSSTYPRLQKWKENIDRVNKKL